MKVTSRQMQTALLVSCMFLGSCINRITPERENRDAVLDHAGMLSSEQIDSLNILINALEKEVGSQIGIWTRSGLEGQRIEAVSFEAFNDRKLGRAEQNDGILILVAKNDKQARIEVGTGLENIITDETAAKLLRDDLIPNFRAGKFGRGLYVAVSRMSELIRDNPKLVGSIPEYKKRFDSIRNDALPKNSE